MRYELDYIESGTRRRMDGLKLLTRSAPGQAWHDTTTLYIVILEGENYHDVAAYGVMRVAFADFLHLLIGLEVTNATPATRANLVEGFARTFAEQVWTDYGHFILRDARRHAIVGHRPRRFLDAPSPLTYPYKTEDGKTLRLTRYHAGEKGPVVLTHGMGANPYTFATDYIRPNLVEYLCEDNFDVWVQEWRGSTQLSTRYESFTADEVAQFDHPAAEAKIREVLGTHDRRLHWITHCVGSITVTMAALKGKITPASIVCSQVAAHPIGAPLMELKARVNAPGLLRDLGLVRVTTDSFAGEGLAGRLLDMVLRLYPIPIEECCKNPVCHRLAFVYGPAIHHKAVDRESHRHLWEFFGVANLEMLEHLGRMVRAGKLVNATGEDVYMDGIEHLRGIPITFLQGMKNHVFTFPSAKRTYMWLLEALPEEAGSYRYHEYPDHGHQDCFMGKNAPLDVFPDILGHLRRAVGIPVPSHP
jgi:cholesterol oxidase